MAFVHGRKETSDSARRLRRRWRRSRWEEEKQEEQSGLLDY